MATASVDTNFAARDQHLRSADFFDSETYPAHQLHLDRGSPGQGRHVVVIGDLTIRNVTRPATFDVVLDGIVPGMGGGRHAGLMATAKLDRDAWGLNWNVALEQGGWLVGKEIKLEIAIAADEIAAAERELAGKAS